MASVNVEEVVYKFLTDSNDATSGTAIQAFIDAGGSLANVVAVIADDAAQQAHIADPTGGSTSDTEARAAIAAILDALEAVGILAAS